MAAGHRVGSLASGGDLVAKLAAQGPDKVLPADSARFPGGWHGPGRSARHPPVPATALWLCASSRSDTDEAAHPIPTPPVSDSPALGTPEPREDPGWARHQHWLSAQRQTSPDDVAAAISTWSLTSRPLPGQLGLQGTHSSPGKCQSPLPLLASPALGSKSTQGLSTSLLPHQSSLWFFRTF